jgi:hypothetical protein
MRTDPLDGRPLEVACDESGYEGEKLIGTTTDVFAHASVRLDTLPAANCMRELRRRIRSPAIEYKANHLLRDKHRSVLTWLLGPVGPLLGNANVYLIDKAFFVVGKVVDLLVDEVADTAGMGVTLYREGGRAFGPELWETFLVSSNNLMRAKDRLDVTTSVDSFFRLVGVLRLAGTPGPVHDILDVMWRARPRADSFRARLLADPAMMSALDPLVPAIVHAVAHWGEGSRPVAIVHDRQTTLSQRRIAQLKDLVRAPDTAFVGLPSGRLTSLSLVDSGTDSRVQIADILAGTARKIASDELNDRGDAQLTALLRPYVDSFSIWGDDRSRSVLGRTSTAQGGSERRSPAWHTGRFR